MNGWARSCWRIRRCARKWWPWWFRQDDGSERNILIVRSAEGLRLVKDLVTSSELLPDEDVSLLPGPDRIDVFTVVKVIGSLEEVDELESVQP